MPLKQPKVIVWEDLHPYNEAVEKRRTKPVEEGYWFMMAGEH